MKTKKIAETLDKFGSIGTDEQIKEAVAKLLNEEAKKNEQAEVYKELYGYVDLTSLTSLDTKEQIWKLTEEVNKFDGSNPEIPNVAAICTYPNFTEIVKQALTADEVKIAAVAASFPSSQTFIEIKIAEIAMAVMEGADEIDVVLNLGLFMEEEYEELCIELDELKESSREAKLKVILETGALKNAENIYTASILSLYSGADFIKTSTGKEYPGATPEAAYVMAKALKKYHQLTGKKAGLKVSGGIRTAEEAVKYYTIVKEVLGEEWLDKNYFRIGASSLVKDLLVKINS